MTALLEAEAPIVLRRQASRLCVLLVLTTALAVLARWGLGYPICGTDEQNYLKIFAWLDDGGVWPVSGPGYAGLILELRRWANWDTASVVATVAMLSSGVVLPLGFWWLYRGMLRSAAGAWLALPWLFASSYFLAGWLEGRPQQLGILLVAAGAALAYRDLQARGHCGFGFFVVWLLCFGYHVLSFSILTALVFGFWAWRFVRGGSGYGALGALLLGLAAALVVGALWWYPVVWQDVRHNHIRGGSALGFFGAFAVAALASLAVLHLLRRLSLGPRLLAVVRAAFASRRAHGLLAAGVAAALIWQYAWLGHLYREVNLLSVIWYQGGNVLLALLFMAGLWRLSRDPVPQLAFFVESCVILMILGGIFLVAIPWLLHQNWTLRVISYWTCFAAPLAAWGWRGLPGRWRWAVLLACPVLVAGALQHVVYAPTWTCPGSGP